jgi:pyridoxamine 5'-phosphate oxidase
MISLSEIRKEYSLGALDESSVVKDPLVQFEKWFQEALKAEIPEPSAMNLATVSENGLPSSRIVLLKGVESGCFVFYTNYQSRKGSQLDENPVCALTFFWPELERQVRIEGGTTRMPEDASIAYFQSRPRESQVGAWASPQSTIIANRSILEGRVKEIEKRFEGKSVLPKPKQWGGFRVEPHWIEFWQGRQSRLHDRILYSRSDKGWKINRLAP